MFRWTTVECVVVLRSRQRSTAVIDPRQLRPTASVVISAAADTTCRTQQAGLPELRTSDVVPRSASASGR